MSMTELDQEMIQRLEKAAAENGLDIAGGKVRRTSSRFCLGVEHGDYNGTELFGVGTDRFIWMAYKPNGTNKMRFHSENFPDDGLVEFEIGNVPEPQDESVADSWARFPYGTEYILRREGIKLTEGFDAVLYGNIPGGGMSRSASLGINLILTMMEVSNLTPESDFKVVELAQAVENDYIGSPCGILDQTMIMFAKEGMGTHFDPKTKKISYVPLGEGAEDFRIVVMDTGTVRPGLEKSTYKVRHDECNELTEMLKKDFDGLTCLADVKDEATYNKVRSHYSGSYPELVKRLDYIYGAQKRFYEMMDAWKAGDVATVGKIFREDGIGLRDTYVISGPELETMCDIVRTVHGVYGERMLGGGDKGAAGCLAEADAVDAIRAAVDTAYPRSRPDFADKYAVHVCKVVDGVKTFDL